MGIARDTKENGGEKNIVFNGPRSAQVMRLSTIDIILITLIIHVHLIKEDRITAVIVIQTPLNVLQQNMPEIKRLIDLSHSSTKFTSLILLITFYLSS